MSAPLVTPDFCRTMARYNLWQNRSLVAAAGALPEAERQRDRAAFWGSIAGTLAHLLWGDEVWMSRLEGTPPPPGRLADSPRHAPGWDDFRARRTALDGHILGWADGLTEAAIAGDLGWFSGA
ncbi:MAG: DinB family protein, partial [Rhodobacteraceae bacterium]|nr:DinB family protein [Paracoccaceae bacterium]